ncbi:hypothetical protein KM043_003651 [Ampulex compressa]|nr:hypothetical protein KM043_003651 [Ampulex compressa]
MRRHDGGSSFFSVRTARGTIRDDTADNSQHDDPRSFPTTVPTFRAFLDRSSSPLSPRFDGPDRIFELEGHLIAGYDDPSRGLVPPAHGETYPFTLFLSSPPPPRNACSRTPHDLSTHGLHHI